MRTHIKTLSHTQDTSLCEQGALHAGVAAAAADVAPRRRAALPLFFNGHEPVRDAGPESALHR